MGRKRSKRGFSSSTNEEGMADTCSANNTLYSELKVSIECLREDPSENHAILKYESTTTISDFAYILCGAIK